MSYAEKNLSKGDTVILQAHTSWLAVVSKAIESLILFIVAAYAKSELYDVGAMLSVVCIVIALIVIIVTVLKITHIELALSNKKLIGKIGIINTKSMDSPLNKINNVSVDQGLFGKIFGYSKITVSTSSGNYVFDYILSGDAFKNTVMEQIDVYENERLRNQAEQMSRYSNQNRE